MIFRFTFFLFSILLLIYLILPGPSSVNSFPPLPDALRSTEEGDTIQVPNIAGYFSYRYRNFVIPFYNSQYGIWGIPFFPLRLNYPPEYAFTAIKDQTYSTYLEELVWPLRDSLFVNGLEPFTEDGQPKYWGAVGFTQEGKLYQVKTTIRFYPSSVAVRLVVWGGIILSMYLIWQVGRKVLKNLEV